MVDEIGQTLGDVKCRAQRSDRSNRVSTSPVPTSASDIDDLPWT